MSFHSLSLRPGDVILMKVNVGEMPAAQAKEYVEKIKDDIKVVFGENQKVIAIATHEPTEFCIINVDV